MLSVESEASKLVWEKTNYLEEETKGNLLKNTHNVGDMSLIRQGLMKVSCHLFFHGLFYPYMACRNVTLGYATVWTKQIYLSMRGSRGDKFHKQKHPLQTIAEINRRERGNICTRSLSQPQEGVSVCRWWIALWFLVEIHNFASWRHVWISLKVVGDYFKEVSQRWKRNETFLIFKGNGFLWKQTDMVQLIIFMWVWWLIQVNIV